VDGIALERGEAIDHTFDREMVCACGDTVRAARRASREEHVLADATAGRLADEHNVKRTLMTLHNASTRARRLIAPLTATIAECGMTNLPNVFRMP